MHMNIRNWFCGLTLILLSVPGVLAGMQTEKIRNEKVLVVEQTLAPGETMTLPTDHPGVIVYLDDGLVGPSPPEAKSRAETVKRGETVFQPLRARALKNVGSATLRLVWTEYFGKGGHETWGSAGLAPHYKLLFENQYGRVYTIKMAAGTSEPLHSHHDRIVVCLSGAELVHEMPDGRKENSKLKTGEIAWRRGGTHIGHNVGKTDLWVIAIEPK
jgi:quercetin dioxygenase-like cupin family protein